MHGIYLVLDPDQVGGHNPLVLVESALAAGIGAVQWRQKSGSVAARWPTLQAVLTACRRADVPLLVNDRVDVALAVGAHGAHLGQDDLPPAEARRLLSDRLLGVSITDPDQIEAAERAGADYLGVGPIFATGSKADATGALGLAGLQDTRARTRLPIVAIGGITIANAATVRAAGADAIAVISAIAGATDPRAATMELRAAFEGTAVR